MAGRFVDAINVALAISEEHGGAMRALARSGVRADVDEFAPLVPRLAALPPAELLGVGWIAAGRTGVPYAPHGDPEFMPAGYAAVGTPLSPSSSEEDSRG